MSKEKSGNVNKSKRKEDYDRNTDERNLNKTLSDFDKSSRQSDTDPQLAEILRKAEEDRKIEKKVKEIIEKPIENKDEDSIAENVDENQNSADNSKGKGFLGSIKKVFGKKKK
jgi:hypothetical protein